jgi:DNA-binding NtrC family response regulator
MTEKKKNVLIVDDEKDVTTYLKSELEDCCQQLNVVVRNSGYEALKVVLQGEVDILITDIAMPDMDGYELYKRAKESQENLPIIMMTGFGYDPNHAVVRSRQAGLKNVVFKPFDITKLVKIIKSNLSEV